MSGQKKFENKSDENPINLAASAELFGGNMELAKQLITLFAAELPKVQQELNSAVTAQDFEMVTDIVHKLHGSACYCGTAALRTAAKELETALREPHRSLSKLAYSEEVKEGLDRKTGVYTLVHEDLSTEPTHKLPEEVEFQKRSNEHTLLELIQNLHQQILAVLTAYQNLNLEPLCPNQL